MISTSTISRLLQTLYGASAAPELWPEFLQQFVDALGISAAGIVYQDAKRVEYGFSSNAGMEPEELHVYETHYGKQDPWVPPVHTVVPGRIEWGRQLCSPSAFRQTEYFHDFAAKFDRNLLCAIPTSRGSESIEAVTLYTCFGAEPHQREVLDLLNLMIPHLQSALNLRRRFIDLNARSSSFESALNLLELGVVLLSRNGEVLCVNRSAETLFLRNDALLVRNKRLYASYPSEADQLSTLVNAVIRTANGKDTRAGGSMLISRNGKRPLSLTAAPLPGEQRVVMHGAAGVLFIYDPEAQVQPPLDLLKHGYGLTFAEARLALLMVEGVSLKEAAEKCGVAHNTVRSQLKSIFSKTNVNHQGELVRLLLRTHLRASSGQFDRSAS